MLEDGAVQVFLGLKIVVHRRGIGTSPRTDFSVSCVPETLLCKYPTGFLKHPIFRGFAPPSAIHCLTLTVVNLIFELTN
jgi:hypothetical protein